MSHGLGKRTPRDTAKDDALDAILGQRMSEATAYALLRIGNILEAALAKTEGICE